MGDRAIHLVWLGAAVVVAAAVGVIRWAMRDPEWRPWPDEDADR